MESNITSINLFPNPPRYYKNFTAENTMPLPDLILINKINTFMTFGNSYDMKKNLNTFSNPVELDFLKFYDSKLIEKKNIPHLKLFQNIASDPKYDISNHKIKILEAVKIEVEYLKINYLQLLNDINNNIDDCDLNSCIIKFSFQKLYYFISQLKKKQVLIELANYFTNEIDRNNNLENTFTKNLEECQITLQEGLIKIKEGLNPNVIK